MTNAPARIRGTQRPADRIFRGSPALYAAGITCLLAAVAIFLLQRPPTAPVPARAT